MNRSLFRRGCAALLFALPAAAPATADETPPVNFPKIDAAVFDRFDDGDGSLSAAEVGDYPWGRFDLDGDGRVTKQEFGNGRLNDRLAFSVERDAEKAWKRLDWTADGKLTGSELDEGTWLSFDRNGDRVVEKAEFLAGRAPSPLPVPNPVPAPDAPSPALADGWKSFQELGFEFQMPDQTKRAHNEGSTLFKFTVPDEHTVYQVLLQDSGDPGTEKMSAEQFDKLRDYLAKTISGEVVEEKPIELLGHPGRELILKTPGGVLMRQRAFIVGSRMIRTFVTTDSQSTAPPAEINRFFASLKLSDGSRPAAGEASRPHVVFVEAMLNQRPEAAYAVLHPSIQKKVDRAVLQMQFAMIHAVMGTPKFQAPPSPESGNAEVEGVKYLIHETTMPFDAGSLLVNTSIAEGGLAGFNFDSPVLTEAAANRAIWNYVRGLNTLEGRILFNEYSGRMDEFVRTLFDQGAEQALALFNPDTQAKFRKEGEPKQLAGVRAEYGPVTKLFLRDYTLQGDDEGLRSFTLNCIATRPGKPAGLVEVQFGIVGLRAEIIGYTFADAADDDTAPPPAAPGAIAPPRTSIAPPRTSPDPPAPPRTDDDVPAPPRTSPPPSAPAPPPSGE